MPEAIANEAAATSVKGHVWIPFAALAKIVPLKINLFVLPDEQQAPSLLHSDTVELRADHLEQIEQRGHERLLIREGDLSSISQALEPMIGRVLADTSLPVALRYCLLQIAYLQPLERNARRLYSERMIELVQQVGKVIAKLLIDNPTSTYALHEQTLRYESNAVHLTNVAAYSVVLAQEMEINEPRELEKIAVGAMLHDFGNLFLPAELIRKTGRLTVQEREQLEHSPKLGYEQLCERTDVDLGQLMMVYQHQERFDGSGYPVAIENDEIHPWARILAVADTFDAMTSARPYRRGTSVADVLLHLADNASRQFDPKVVLCWITNFQQA